MQSKKDRLDSWNKQKYIINERVNFNFTDDGNTKFKIKPWSIWWFDIGENIGTETSCHFTSSDIIYKRPCIVVSTNNFNNAGYNKKVIIMPLTSLKENTKIKHFHYKLSKEKYNSFFDEKRKIKYSGLQKDSLVICNDIKTIDTKRLTEHMYTKLDDVDIENIKQFIGKYFGI